MVSINKQYVLVLIGVTFIKNISSASIGNINATSWSKMADCFRQKLGPSSIDDADVRCAAREMIASFDVMDKKACKNCQTYFDCEANRNAITNCAGKIRAEEAAIAVGECMKARGHIMDNSACEFGRAGNDCKTRYLCSSNCNYNPDLKTCSKTNCRPAIKGERKH